MPPRPGSTVRDVLPIWRRGVASNFSAKNQKQERNYPSSSVTHRQNDPEELKEKALTLVTLLQVPRNHCIVAGDAKDAKEIRAPEVIHTTKTAVSVSQELREDAW